MKADPRFVRQPKAFWAHVRSISQQIGYTDRNTKTVLVPTLHSVVGALRGLGLNTQHIQDRYGNATKLGALLLDYFAARAKALRDDAKPNLMNKEAAKDLYGKLKDRTKVKIEAPTNKQKGEKSGVAYLTGIVSILIAENVGCSECDYAPRSLTTFTHNGKPLRTLARWLDGAFPSTINPIAVWEIKEYYNTKTFGSRVADGVYESLLDGMELEELREHEGRDCQHVLFVDDHFTWWDCGRSYLCRMFDMLHMGYVDEIIFGREAVARVPALAREWVELHKESLRKTGASGAGAKNLRRSSP